MNSGGTLVPLEFYHLMREAADHRKDGDSKGKMTDKSRGKRPSGAQPTDQIKKLKADGNGAVGPSSSAVQKFLAKKAAEEKKKAAEMQRQKESLLKARLEANGGKISKKIADAFQLDLNGKQLLLGQKTTTKPSTAPPVRQTVASSAKVSTKPADHKSTLKNTAGKSVPSRKPPEAVKKSSKSPAAPLGFSELLQIASKVKDKPVSIIPKKLVEIPKKKVSQKPPEPTTKNLPQIAPKSRLSREGLYCTSVGVKKGNSVTQAKYLEKHSLKKTSEPPKPSGIQKMGGKNVPQSSSHDGKPSSSGSKPQPPKGSKLSNGIGSSGKESRSFTNGQIKSTIPPKYQKPSYNPFDRPDKNSIAGRLPTKLPPAHFANGRDGPLTDDSDYDQEEDDYDSEMDDFIDDTPIEADSKG